MRVYTMDNEDCLIQYLCNHKEIDSEKFTELSKSLIVVIRKPSFWSRLYKKTKDENYVINIAKMRPIEE